MATKKVESKETAIIERNANTAVKAAEDLKITDDKTLASGVELLSKVNKVGDQIKATKAKQVKPIREGLNAINDFWKPFEGTVKEATATVKKKIIEYNTKVEEAQKKEADRLAARVEKGTMKPETAAKKLEEAPIASKPVVTKEGAINYRTIRKVEIEDESKLPREYLIPDSRKIRVDALAGKDIPGVKVVEEKTIANTR